MLPFQSQKRSVSDANQARAQALHERILNYRRQPKGEEWRSGCLFHYAKLCFRHSVRSNFALAEVANGLSGGQN